MEQFSPLTRRIIAVALLVLTLVSSGTFVVAPLWRSCAQGLGDLATARSRLARMQSIIDEPAPVEGDIVPASAIIIAANRNRAVAALIGIVGAGAGSTKLAPQVTPVARTAGPAARVAVDVAASGSEIDLVTLLAAIESASPAARLQSWSIAAPAAVPGPATMQARVVAIWATHA